MACSVAESKSRATNCAPPKMARRTSRLRHRVQASQHKLELNPKNECRSSDTSDVETSLRHGFDMRSTDSSHQTRSAMLARCVQSAEVKWKRDEDFKTRVTSSGLTASVEID